MISDISNADSVSMGSPVVYGAYPANAADRVIELEQELDDLSRVVSQRFEELALIHELTDRLNLDSDLATICASLLSHLAPCVRADTIAIDIFGDEDSDLKPQLLQFGETLKENWYAKIQETFDNSAPATIVNDWIAPSGRTMRMTVVRIDHQQLVLGHMIAIRDGNDEEFGTIEADLMKSTSMMLGMHIANQRQYLEMQQMLEGTIQSLVSALDAKDTYTCGHSTRVADLAVELAAQLQYSDKQLAVIRMAGILHDIGKIGVDDSVLRKPGKLTDDEFEQIKQHPVLGYEILKGIRRFRDILPVVRHHHESWDGRGYPDALSGDQIPRDAQIVAVADAYDAMTSDRPYRPGMSLEKVLAIFRDGRGTHWAPDVVDVLLGLPLLKINAQED